MAGIILITIGLALDILGAIWLYWHAIKLTKRGAADLAATAWNGNKELEQFFLFHAQDARIGLVLLIIGFLLQIFGVWLQWASSLAVSLS